jgi:hypothetical protein
LTLPHLGPNIGLIIAEKISDLSFKSERVGKEVKVKNFLRRSPQMTMNQAHYGKG